MSGFCTKEFTLSVTAPCPVALGSTNDGKVANVFVAGGLTSDIIHPKKFWKSNGTADVSLFDADNLMFLGTLNTLGLFPEEVIYDSISQLVIITMSDLAGTFDPFMQVTDAVTNALVSQTDVNPGAAFDIPRFASFDSVHHKVYSSINSDSQLLTFDPITFAFSAATLAPGYTISGTAHCPTIDLIAISERGATKRVRAYAAIGHALLHTFTLGGTYAPERIAYASDSNLIYVLARDAGNNNTIYGLNPTTFLADATIALPAAFGGSLITYWPDKKLLVITTHTLNRIAFVDVTSNTLLCTVTAASTPEQAGTVSNRMATPSGTNLLFYH